jgi:uncharacterized membrane protein
MLSKLSNMRFIGDILTFLFFATRIYVFSMLLWTSFWTILDRSYQNLSLVLFVIMFLRDMWMWGKRSMVREIDVIKTRAEKLSQSNVVTSTIDCIVKKTGTAIYDGFCQIFFSSEPITEKKPDKLRLFIDDLKFFSGSLISVQWIVFSKLFLMLETLFQMEGTCKNTLFVFFFSIYITLFCTYLVNVWVRNNFFTKTIVMMIKMTTACWNHKKLFNQLHLLINIAVVIALSINEFFARIRDQQEIDQHTVMNFFATMIIIFLDFFYKNKYINVQEVQDHLLTTPSTNLFSEEVKRIIVVVFAIIISLSDIVSTLKSTFLIAVAFYFVSLHTSRSIVQRVDRDQIFTWLEWLIKQRFVLEWLVSNGLINSKRLIDNNDLYIWLDGVRTFFIGIKELYAFFRTIYKAESVPFDQHVANLGSMIRGQKTNIKHTVIIVMCAVERLIELTEIPSDISLTIQKNVQKIMVIRDGEEMIPTPDDMKEYNHSQIMHTRESPDQCIKIVKNSRYVDPVITDDESASFIWNIGKSLCSMVVGSDETTTKTVSNSMIKFSITKTLVPHKVQSLVEYMIPGINDLMGYKTYLEVVCTVDNMCNDEIMTKIFELVKMKILADQANLVKSKTD